MIEVEFLPWLSEQLGGPEFRSRHLDWQVEVREGETVGEVCTRLAEGSEAFRRLVFDPTNQRFVDQVMVVLNDRLLELCGGLHAILQEGDRLAVVPAMAGGVQDGKRPTLTRRLAVCSSPCFRSPSRRHSARRK